MYIVEFIQLLKKEKSNQCIGFYEKEKALEYALKLNMCSNIESVMVSEVDTTYADIIYDSNNKND